MKNVDYEEDKKGIDLYGINWNDDFKVSSSMDCTGLIPAPVQTDSELEAYQELYPFLTKASDTKDT